MKVAVIMGSSSDWPIMKEACDMLEYFNIQYEKKVVSAHRTPLEMVDFAKNATDHNIDIIIAERQKKLNSSNSQRCKVN